MARKKAAAKRPVVEAPPVVVFEAPPVVEPEPPTFQAEPEGPPAPEYHYFDAYWKKVEHYEARGYERDPDAPTRKRSDLIRMRKPK